MEKKYARKKEKNPKSLLSFLFFSHCKFSPGFELVNLVSMNRLPAPQSLRYLSYLPLAILAPSGVCTRAIH